MQTFDALTLRAVLQEAKPLMVNRKVDSVHQINRDEIILTLRSKAGLINLILSAHTAYGRLCLGKPSSSQAPRQNAGKPGGGSQSSFLMLLRKHLGGATLIALEQPPGERSVDFVFSCLDEVGAAVIKILTAEIMSRHSNLIFWDKNSGKIICTSHVVTKEMSRQREVAPGLRFVRPPGQDKPNIFLIDKASFLEKITAFESAVKSCEALQPPLAPTLDQWLLNTCTGLGRHLAAELTGAASTTSHAQTSFEEPELKENLWRRIESLRKETQYRPAMRLDLSAYTVLPWLEIDNSPEWKIFPSVNDLIEEYYRLCEAREQFNQLRERLRSDLKAENDKFEQRLAAASQYMSSDSTLVKLRQYGDLVLANITRIGAGQEELNCQNVFDAESAEPVIVKLNPNLSPSQNAQAFYRSFAKARARQNAASIAMKEAGERLEQIRALAAAVEKASDLIELRRMKELMLGRKPQEAMRKEPQQQNKKNRSRLLTTTSSDGWTIYVGRNREENDYLLSKLAQPFDLWLHIQGQGGAHVLIRVPASKQDPPLTTIKEAATVAAKLSKASSGSKVRVVYTQCRYVKKIAREKPGVVRYENERTIEVDTGAPMPKCMRQLFQQ